MYCYKHEFPKEYTSVVWILKVCLKKFTLSVKNVRKASIITCARGANSLTRNLTLTCHNWAQTPKISHLGLPASFSNSIYGISWCPRTWIHLTHKAKGNPKAGEVKIHRCPPKWVYKIRRNYTKISNLWPQDSVQDMAYTAHSKDSFTHSANSNYTSQMLSPGSQS